MKDDNATARQPDLHVRLDGVDVGQAARGLTAKTSIEELPSAEFVLDLDAVPGAPDVPVDYLAEVQISVAWESREDVIFTGRVLSATPTEEGIAVRCGGGVALEEQLLPPFGTWNVQAADIIYLITRSAGLSPERLAIAGLEDLPVEVFEVAVPVTGVAVGVPSRLGPVRFLPPADGEGLLYGTRPRDELRQRFFEGDGYCVACVTAKTMFEAEQAALADIDAAVSWLAVRTRYGHARLPGGESLTFRRESSHSQPGFLPVLVGYGMKTNRTWMRVTGMSRDNHTLSLTDFTTPSLPTSLTIQDRQALLACRRAATEGDPLARIAALWEAIEYYAARTKVPRLFSHAELDAIGVSLEAADLSEMQAIRAREAVASMNTPPLLTRLRAAVAADGVPISDQEIALLQRLRRLRNDAVHGRGSATPELEEIEHAVSVVSRMLAFRLKRNGGRV
jgi:hypothetical protein